MMDNSVGGNRPTWGAPFPDDGSGKGNTIDWGRYPGNGLPSCSPSDAPAALTRMSPFAPTAMPSNDVAPPFSVGAGFHKKTMTTSSSTYKQGTLHEESTTLLPRIFMANAVFDTPFRSAQPEPATDSGVQLPRKHQEHTQQQLFAVVPHSVVTSRKRSRNDP